MLDAWQVQIEPSVGEGMCSVWGGAARPCLLRTEIDDLAIDVVGVRITPQHFERGCRLPAHGTVTFEVRTSHVRRALEQLVRSREAVVLQRPDGGAIEMRFCDPAATGDARPPDRSSTSTVTLGWQAP